jgi:hypothetical protein
LPIPSLPSAPLIFPLFPLLLAYSQSWAHFFQN